MKRNKKIILKLPEKRLPSIKYQSFYCLNRKYETLLQLHFISAVMIKKLYSKRFITGEFIVLSPKNKMGTACLRSVGVWSLMVKRCFGWFSQGPSVAFLPFEVYLADMPPLSAPRGCHW